MITLIFGQMNCGKHNVSNQFKNQIDEEAIDLSELRKKYGKELLDENLINELSCRFGFCDFADDDILLTAACKYFTEEDMLIIVPNFLIETACRCCSELSHVRCLLVAPSADAIAKRRRATVSEDSYHTDYAIPSKYYFDKAAIYRNTALLVREALATARAYNIKSRFWCYVAPEYLI